MYIYLDQMQWIYLARGRTGRDTSYEPAYSALRELARSGQASFPLSSVHYMETLSHRNASRRSRLAETMLELARPSGRVRPLTIAGGPEVLRREIDSALATRLGREPPFPQYPIFGEGVGHAFGKRVEYRVPDGFPITPKRRREFERHANRALETGLLGVPVGTLREPKVDIEISKRPSIRFMDGDRKLVDELARLRPTREQRHRWMQGLSLIDILDEINAGLARAGAMPGDIGHSPEELTSFLFDLPSRHVDYELQRLRHDNPQLARTQTDLDDLAALSVAVPYCDVVVTERLWVDLIKRARLDDQYRATVIADVRQLPELLSATG